MHSAQNESDRHGHLELHPKPKVGQTYDATVITALSPKLFYVSSK